MNNRLKIKPEASQSIWLTSDGHWNQENLEPCANRGYDSRDSRTWGQIISWNQVVTNNDIVFDLGDLTFNDPDGQFFYMLMDKLNFKHLYLIAGNHHSGLKNWFQLDKPETKQWGPNKKVTYLGFYWEMIIYKQLIIASHFPIAVWNEMAKGSWCISGHSHYNFSPSRADDKTSKILDVGWDGHKRPINFFELKTIMDTKGIAKLDHHV